MTSLLSRWLRPKMNLSHWRVTVYTRRQCGCCHSAVDVLEEYQRRHGFAIEQVDVDSDPALVALYDTTVPVVSINGKVRFRGKVNPVLLDRLIAADAGREEASPRS